MSAAPTGTVTFLFTDIEGSTRLAQQFPSAWLAAQARRRAVDERDQSMQELSR